MDYKNLDIEEKQLRTVQEQLSLYLASINQEVKEGKDLNVVSLFSGCGGMDLGFEGGFKAHKRSISADIYEQMVVKSVDDNFVELKETRFNTVFANDILPDARNTWVYNFKKKGHKPEVYHTESIVNLVKLHKQGVKVFPDRVDIVTGGFPCQDFSVAGKRSGFNSHRKHDGKLADANLPSEETRGKLYFWMKQVIEITKPKMFIAENVKGLVNLADVKEIIQKDFASASGDGYIVLSPRVLHSANYGVSQSRERVIFIGIKKSALTPEALLQLTKETIDEAWNPYPRITHARESFVPVHDILRHLDEPANSVDTSQQYYSKAKWMGKHCQGQSEIDLQKIAPTIRAEHHGNIEFRRLAEEHGGKHTEELKLGKVERRLTVRECGLIQSFPPDYDFVIKSEERKGKFVVSPSQAYKVIGNAVPPLMAYHIARRIESLWDIYFKQ